MINNIYKNVYGRYFIPDSVLYTYTADYIVGGGVHEDTTIDYLRLVGGNIIHAGAGFGDFLPALGGCDSVWAFEPNRLMYSSCLCTMLLNSVSNVKLFPLALGGYDGVICLRELDVNGVEMGPRSEVCEEGVEVGVVRLDSIIPVDCRISLIHLDLEGYEFEALRGAMGIIERDSPVIVLEIDGRAVDYNNFMLSIGYVVNKQLIFNSNERMVFVNTVYSKNINKF